MTTMHKALLSAGFTVAPAPVELNPLQVALALRNERDLIMRRRGQLAVNSWLKKLRRAAAIAHQDGNQTLWNDLRNAGLV